MCNRRAILRSVTARKLRHMCNLHIKETEIYLKNEARESKTESSPAVIKL